MKGSVQDDWVSLLTSSQNGSVCCINVFERGQDININTSMQLADLSPLSELYKFEDTNH